MAVLGDHSARTPTAWGSSSASRSGPDQLDRRAVRLRAGPDLLEARKILLARRDDELAAPDDLDAVVRAVLLQLGLALAAQAGLHRARGVVDPGVDHAAVVPGLLPADRRVLLDDPQPGAGRSWRIRRAVARPTIPAPTMTTSSTAASGGMVRPRGGPGRQRPPRDDAARADGRRACAHRRRARRGPPRPPTSSTPSASARRVRRRGPRTANRRARSNAPRRRRRSRGSCPRPRRSRSPRARPHPRGRRPPVRIVYSCVTHRSLARGAGGRASCHHRTHARPPHRRRAHRPLRSRAAARGGRPVPPDVGRERRARTAAPPGRRSSSCSPSEGGHFSALHRLPIDEVWFFQLGDPIELLLLHADGSTSVERLGPDVLAGDELQVVVPAGTWMGARVAPGRRVVPVRHDDGPGLHPERLRGRRPGRARGRLPRAGAADPRALSLTSRHRTGGRVASAATRASRPAARRRST